MNKQLFPLSKTARKVNNENSTKHKTVVSSSFISYIVDPPKCINYRIMLHCGNEKV